MKCKKMNKGLFSKKNIQNWGKTSVVQAMAQFDYGVIIKARRGELPWAK